MAEIQKRVEVKKVEFHSGKFLKMTLKVKDVSEIEVSLLVTPEEVYSLGKVFEPGKTLKLIIKD